jgi:hypothetical protein
MYDKTELTKKREQWANYYFDNKNVHPLEIKYGNYLYVPLDIPFIELSDHEKFVSYYFKNSRASTKIKHDVSGASLGSSTFLSIDGVPSSDRSVWSKNFIPSFRTEFKELFDQILEYFPIKSLDNFIIWSSIADVHFHKDESIMLDLPVHFRIMLHNPNDTSTLLLRQDTVTPISIPQETNSFAWNNLRIEHGSELKKPKILFLFGDPLDIDWKKYDCLMEKSIIKYRNSTIIDTVHSTGDYVSV